MCPWIQCTVNTHPSQAGSPQLSTAAPSSPSKQGWWQWCEAVALDQGNSVWAHTTLLPLRTPPLPPPPPVQTPAPPSTHPPPLSVERAMTLGPSDSAPQTCLFLSQQWKLAWCWTPMHAARLRGCSKRACICVCVCVSMCLCVSAVCVCLCGLEWQCHLLIMGPVLCRQGDLAERLRGLAGYHCALWQVSPIRGLSKQRFHKTVRMSKVSRGDSAENTSKFTDCTVTLRLISFLLHVKMISPAFRYASWTDSALAVCIWKVNVSHIQQ